MNNNLVSFEDTYLQDRVSLQQTDPDAFACITIDGYPANEDAPGQTVCQVWMSMHGDIITSWSHNGYRLNTTVLELIQKAKTRLRTMFAEANQTKAGDSNKAYIAVLKSSAVRDVQYAAKPDAELLDDDAWNDLPDAEIYLGVYAGLQQAALQNVAEHACTDPANIRLIPIQQQVLKAGLNQASPATLRQALQLAERRSISDVVRAKLKEDDFDVDTFPAHFKAMVDEISAAVENDMITYDDPVDEAVKRAIDKRADVLSQYSVYRDAN